MSKSSLSTPYAKRLAEKFRESQANLRANGFRKPTKTLHEDLETPLINNTNTSTISANTTWL